MTARKITDHLKSHRSQSIDALRAIAAFFVLFHHAYLKVPSGVLLYDHFLSFFQAYGVLGVDLFFIISGFCIHWGYSKPGVAVDPKKYLVRRWWRIYPPYFFALGLAVLFNLLTNAYKLTAGSDITWNNFGAFQILSHVFLVHNLFDSSFLTVSGPFWTIAMEAQYYLLYLLARPLFFTKRGWLIVFGIALSLHLAAWTMWNQKMFFQPLGPFRYWLEWLSGAFVVYLLRKHPSLLRGWPVYAGLFILGVLSIGGGLYEYFRMDTSRTEFVVIIMSVLLILVCLRFENVWAMPVLRWFPACGSFSYSIYLVHFLLMDRLRVFVIPRISEGWPRFAASVGSMIFCLLFSYIFFLFFEKKFLEKAASFKTNQLPIEIKSAEIGRS